MQRNYSVVYSKIVNDDADLIGHIAYSLYKNEKCNYIEEQSKEGKNLSDEDLIHFHAINSSGSNIIRYRVHAEVILQDFLSSLISDQIRSAEIDMNSKHEAALSTIVKNEKTSHGTTVLLGLASAVLFAILISALGFILEYNGAFIRFSIEKPNQEASAPATQ